MPDYRAHVGNSQYLKGADIPRPIRVTIARASIEKMNDDSEKLVVWFRELEKGLVLNVVNGQAIEAAALTTDYDEWAGVRVGLWFNPDVEFQGQRKGGLRVKPLTDEKAEAPAPSEGAMPEEPPFNPDDEPVF